LLIPKKIKTKPLNKSLKNTNNKIIFTKNNSILGEIDKKSKEYISELEEKIVELSLKLKSKTNELNSLNESNKKIIGKLIHNLKNPIGVIFSFSEMMLEDFQDYSSEKMEKHLQIIKNSAGFSIQLLNIIAKYSQLQSPDLELNFKRLNYIELLNTIINEFGVLAEEKKIAIKRNFTENAIFLKVDEEEISLVIRNIMSNAVRYSNENSTITITVTETNNSVETVITDEGIGISEGNLSAIFNEFYVVNTYSSDKQKCIGLGLPIARKIIQLHKGEISVKSNINKGSSFKITLPA